MSIACDDSFFFGLRPTTILTFRGHGTCDLFHSDGRARPTFAVSDAEKFPARARLDYNYAIGDAISRFGRPAIRCIGKR
jgi:hypothetical protein